MTQYNFDAFLKEMSELNLSEIIREATQLGTAIDDSATGGHKGVVQARKRGALDYSRRIGDFLFFLQNGRRPSGVDDEEFKNYLIVVRPLVEKKQLRPSILELFGEKGIDHD